MEQDHGKKQYVCKLCNKSFLSGRILGGHMRTHRVKNSGKEAGKVESSDMGNEGSYGLRENPKKSWKSSIFKDGDDDDGVLSVQESAECRICGKQFESPRSLHGHMRHHSVEERNGSRCKECGKGFKTLRSLTGHMRLHSLKNRVSKESITPSGPDLVVIALSASETVTLARRKRSNRVRYKVTAPNSSFSSMDESVSGFELEQEVKDAAMCLMMLSGGVCEWVGFRSASDSLDNDSLSLEVKPLDGNKGIECSEVRVDVFDDDDGELVKKKKPRTEKFDSCASDSKNKSSECSDCEIAMGFDEKKIELELPVVSFYQAADSNRPEVEGECGSLLFDTEIDKGIQDEIGSTASDTDSNQDRREEVGLDLAGPGHVKWTTSSNNFDVCDADMGTVSCTELICSTSDSGDSKKKSQYQCRICNKILPNHQALGGHQTLHRRTTKSSRALKIDQCQEDIQADVLPKKINAESEVSKTDGIKESVKEEENGVAITSFQLNKSKKHQCHICFKLFVSGQALGGHKRTHLAKATEEQDMAMQQEVPDLCGAFDINLPAMIDTEANNEAEFKSYWAETSYNHESLLDVIAT